MIEVKQETQGIFSAVLATLITGELYVNYRVDTRGMNINLSDYYINGLESDTMTLVNRQDPKDVIDIDVTFTVKSSKK